MLNSAELGAEPWRGFTALESLPHLKLQCIMLVGVILRLRHRVRAVEQEDRDLLVGLLADVHRAMNALGWLFPLDLSRRDLNALALASIGYSIKRTSPVSTTAQQ